MPGLWGDNQQDELLPRSRKHLPVLRPRTPIRMEKKERGKAENTFKVLYGFVPRKAPDFYKGPKPGMDEALP